MYSSEGNPRKQEDGSTSKQLPCVIVESLAVSWKSIQVRGYCNVGLVHGLCSFASVCGMCIRTYVHDIVRTCMYIHTYVRTYVHVRTYTCTCTQIRINVFVIKKCVKSKMYRIGMNSLQVLR